MPKHPKSMPPAEAIEQMEQYRLTGEVKFRNAVIEGNAGMLIKLVNNDRYKFPNIDIQDLLQEARIGFTKGLENYSKEAATSKHGTAKPANYAFHYARGAVLAFIREHGYNIPIPDKCHRAYKLMMTRVEAAQQEYHTENLSPLSFMGDQQPYKQDGAMAIANRHYLDPTNVEDEIYYNHGPSRSDLHCALNHLSAIPEPQRSVVRAHFGIGDESAEEMMERTGFDNGTVIRVVQGVVQKLRRLMYQTVAPEPKSARDRVFAPAHQPGLFQEEEVSRKGPR